MHKWPASVPHHENLMIYMPAYICVIGGLGHILKGQHKMWPNSDRIYSTSIDISRYRVSETWCSIDWYYSFMWNVHYFRFLAMKMKISISHDLFLNWIFIHRKNHIFSTHLCCCFYNFYPWPIWAIGYFCVLCRLSVCPSLRQSIHPSCLCYHYTAHNISWILFVFGLAIDISMRINPNDYGFLC